MLMGIGDRASSMSPSPLLIPAPGTNERHTPRDGGAGALLGPRCPRDFERDLLRLLSDEGMMVMRSESDVTVRGEEEDGA